jgi:uncharacterized protein DUF3226
MVPPALHLPRTATEITFPKLLVVEGRDEYAFFVAALNHLSLQNSIQVRNFGGITEWPTYLPTLVQTPGFERVVSLGIIRDAETNADNAFASVRDALGRAGLPVPAQPNVVAPGKPAVRVYILPDCARPGMLETLCLEAVRDDPASRCVDSYLACLRRRGAQSPTNRDKARVQAFLASRPSVPRLIGEAASAGDWPWDHPAFQLLLTFLRAL